MAMAFLGPKVTKFQVNVQKNNSLRTCYEKNISEYKMRNYFQNHDSS